MGTSNSYDAPTNPPWPDLKRRVSNLAQKGRLTRSSAREIVYNFIAVHGGPKQMAGGSGGRNAQNVAHNIARFISSVEVLGLQDTLRQEGLENLIGKSVNEISLTLIDYLGRHASTIDEVDARNALSRLMNELLEGAENLEDIERVLETKSQQSELETLLIKFFGYYIFEQFCRVFYERLTARVGENQAEMFLDGILDYIISALRHKTFNKDVSTINWRGEQGKAVTSEILLETLDVFGN